MTWQERLLPLMTRMVVGLTLFFFAATLVQLMYLQWRIEKVPEMRVTPSEHIGIQSMVDLEVGVLRFRYHQGKILLMARVWTHYLGFITGMILALTGAVFILGRLRETTSELGAKLAATELNMRTASPGLMLATLGVVLMLSTIIFRHRIEIVDRPVYLHEMGVSSTQDRNDEPKLKPPQRNSTSTNSS